MTEKEKIKWLNKVFGKIVPEGPYKENMKLVLIGGEFFEISRANYDWIVLDSGGDSPEGQYLASVLDINRRDL